MPVLSTILELVGFALVVAAASFVAVPLALLVAGGGLIFAAQGLESGPKT